MAEPTERDPLIRKPVVHANAETARAEPDVKRRLGPLEISPSNRRGILAGIWLASFLGSLNSTLVPTMLPSISSDFQKFHQASWLGTGYLLATCTFTPLYGRLCNVMGRRGANHTAIVFAAMGTAGCGLARNMEELIVARFIAGIGGGGLFTTSTIIVSDMYTLRVCAIAFLSTTSADFIFLQRNANSFPQLGMGLGGPFGGLITDLMGWRAAFLLQVPLYLLAFLITQYNIRYVTPGKSKGTKEVLKRIDYFGSLTLLISRRLTPRVPQYAWSDARVIAPLTLAIVFFFAFSGVEIFVAPEPVMAPAMLKQKIPVLVSASNFLVAACNFSVTYFFPMWFQVVTLQSASTAGLHLMPNSISMSTGSVFAGWVMHRTGRYKKLNLTFGIFPFVGATLISFLHEDSGPIQSWLSIIPLGFGNAVVLQTMLIALLANLPESHMAVGTGFGQLFRGIGQVGGVAISSAIFQSRLDTELRKRFHTPDAEELIMKIRRNSAFVRTLMPDQQRDARDSYSLALKAVYIFAACSTFLAYCVRLPIPDQDLDKAHARRRQSAALAEGRRNSAAAPGANAIASSSTTPPESASATETETEVEPEAAERAPTARPNAGGGRRQHRRRLSTFESTDGTMDLESDKIGGSARVMPPRGGTE
ncbi:Vacuolar amino acid permease [Mycena venus]|uniref:Vacuolar amino acid permease n=1 Tax=Mycena venus TaxID=2733690 RepID=A0A8H6Y7M4_9AGAR|nr:Vacuolar amino acid permease [Mycena venus]